MPKFLWLLADTILKYLPTRFRRKAKSSQLNNNLQDEITVLKEQNSIKDKVIQVQKKVINAKKYTKPGNLNDNLKRMRNNKL